MLLHFAPYFGNLLFFRPTLDNFSHSFVEFRLRAFYILYVFFVFPVYFYHDVFMHHTMVGQLWDNTLVGHGGALVESMTFKRRVVGSTPALAAM